MSAPPRPEPEGAGAVFARGVRAADLFAIDPAGLGGIRVRAQAGPVREAFLAALVARLPAAPFAKIPASVTVDRLLGGLALAETLRSGTPVFEPGLLGTLDGGVALLAMAERLPAAAVAPLSEALDRGEVTIARDGFTRRLPARLGLVALDEGIDEEALAPALADRLAFEIALDGVDRRSAVASAADPDHLAAARARLAAVTVADPFLVALTEAAVLLGIASLRAPLLALRAALAHAALAGRTAVAEADVIEAVGLVLAPRATRLPAIEEPEPAPPEEAPDNPSDPKEAESAQAAADSVVEASLAALPADLLAAIGAAASRAPASAAPGRGAAYSSRLRGRPTGVRAGRPGRGARLSVLDTMKAAAPWQAIRRAAAGPGKGLRVLPDDFRVRTYKDRREGLTIFLVDASGSMALARLAEAKGAIEMMLAQSYSRRDSVALVGFRGTGASLLLPPTRSLTRARRLLAGLPGGGGTPLAAGLDAAGRLAEVEARKGRTPAVILLSDARANVCRDGEPGRARAREEALEAARRLAASAVGTLVIDTGRRPGPEGQTLAEAARGRYLWLPAVDAERILGAVDTPSPR